MDTKIEENEDMNEFNEFDKEELDSNHVLKH